MHPHLRILPALMLVFEAIPALATEPFDYFQNSWSVIGLRDYNDGTRITPDNELLLANKIRARIRFGRDLHPLSREQTKTLMDGWLPVVELAARDGDVAYAFTLWATPLPTASNIKAAFNGPTEGESYLNWIRVRITNRGGTTAEAKVRVETVDSASPLDEPLTRSLEPAATAEYIVRVPFAPLTKNESFAKEEAQPWLDRTEQYWRELLAAGAQIDVPEPKVTEALKAAHVCQLIAADHGELHGGEGFYDLFYIRDAGYQIMELEEAGLWNAVRPALAAYLKSQRPDGRFETQKGQFDANGQAVWVLWQYYKITGDKEWLAKVYPQMKRAAGWTIAARTQAAAGSPFAGLLPAAVADGENLWDGKHHIVGYDLWNLRCLVCTADAARQLGQEADAKELTNQATAYRTSIDAACKHSGKDYFPPSWEGPGTFWGNTETMWPTELFADNDPRVARTIEAARKTHGGGFVEGTIRWIGAKEPAIHPYMSAYTTMADITLGHDEQVVEDFYWYLLHASATHAFPEGIHHQRRFAWSDTIPHVTGASNYALMLRHMLVHERGDELHLLPAVPDRWLAEGKEIRIDRAPTHFGELSLHVRGTANGIAVEFTPPTRLKPSRIVLHVPQSRLAREIPSGVIVERRPDQSKRWDFPTVVGIYEKTAPPLAGQAPRPQTTPAP